MMRVFEFDDLVCPHCEGQRKLIAFLTDGSVVRRILPHLGLDSEPPHLAPARRLEEGAFAWVAGDAESLRGASMGQRALEGVRARGCVSPLGRIALAEHSTSPGRAHADPAGARNSPRTAGG